MTTELSPDAPAPVGPLERARGEYEDLAARGLSLDLTRGKPAPEQLDLSEDLLSLPGGRHTAADGTDVRNYGGLQGLPELREIFADLLQVPAAQLLALGNSSLELMHDCIVHALLGEVPGATSRWVDQERVAFLCPVPGYDRHFGLCERFGIDMIPVPMTAEGPDMDEVERLAAEDPAVKGIWCVPKYSNPDGVSYSDETVARLARMETAAPDFRIFWDNAYAVHHLTDEPVEIADILGACAEAGHPDRAFVFGSTSKITAAGAGVAFFGSSPANVTWLLAKNAKRSIGPDKINQLRHVMFLRDADGVRAHMERQRALLQPKFEAVARILDAELGGTGLATWTAPKGGYFVTLTVPDGCAKEVVKRAAEAGIVLTPAGATHPYGDDPRDAVIRVAPSYPGLAELEQAIHGLTVCVRLVGLEQQAAR
ncbi:aminotransferase [Streptomyces alfalfae]|uniref:Aminotransferase n=1 Tax=Streptomyces alfalfae TaxID=1642299 RepID=A0A1P8TLF4_9ACTN|nr:aminotransferase class I/II-fold pyridoxal phosphate-dependent enzyme [Streptomyces alfalfae]AYA18829.1 aminotransferase class I/II-fold pyridoxal phosphate-dependent enzyme [Streptomyces fradiae]APY88419.1 aminotransferase [Streptomyces alfalfae]QQC89200.1 aminotransferase class I/II-fold pyridoxal phosphate-dependent enzyme [Streptomyces alfalfae]QUI31651.1 aminotransferase class I/II-fold pyridoxal phosphate-dependent enzyme [Streptomyces alfalfae]RXX46044.1 aminotransferase [Streptomyce